MSKITNRDTPRRDRGSVEHRLARLLETPLLARVVPHLPPETLHQLIRHCGLDACSEILKSATPAQLVSLLDLDLWRHGQPGRDQQFDVEAGSYGALPKGLPHGLRVRGEAARLLLTLAPAGAEYFLVPRDESDHDPAKFGLEIQGDAPPR